MSMISKQNNITSENGIDEDQTWKIIGNFFEKRGLSHHQLESFNDYINNGIQSVISEEADIKVETSNGKYVISGKEDYYLRLWNIETGSLIWQYKNDKNYI